MHKYVKLGGLLAVAGLGFTTLVWSGIVPNPIDRSHGAISACIEKTQEQLRSPSSFKLIWSDYTARGPLTWEESLPPHEDYCARANGGSRNLTDAFQCHLDKLKPKVQEKMRNGLPLTGHDEELIADTIRAVDHNKKDIEARLARNLPEDQTAHITLEYDADNGFGSQIRNFAMCRFGAVGIDGRFQKSEIILSGPIDAALGRDTKELQERLDSQ